MKVRVTTAMKMAGLLIIIALALTVVAFAVLSALGIFSGDAYEISRPDHRLMRLQRIARAVDDYDSQHGVLKPAICDETYVDCFSWRVAIAPLLRSIPEGEGYRFTEHWSSTYNRRFAFVQLFLPFCGILHPARVDDDKFYSDYVMISHEPGGASANEKRLRIVEVPCLSIEVTECEEITAEEYIEHLADGGASETGEEFILGLRFDGTISRLELAGVTQREAQDFVSGGD